MSEMGAKGEPSCIGFAFISSAHPYDLPDPRRAGPSPAPPWSVESPSHVAPSGEALSESERVGNGRSRWRARWRS